ncbi:MAG: GNAT family N-acetyltransferase [Thermomicrobiales bacterium]
MTSRTYAMTQPEGNAIAAFARSMRRWDTQDPLGSGFRGGDLGWAMRDGAAWITANTRIWTDRTGSIVAGGVLEGELGIWMQMEAAHLLDHDLARAIVDDVRGVGIREVAGAGVPSALRAELALRGATIDPDPWPHLWRPLTDDDLVTIPGVFSTATDALIAERIRVQRSAFERSTFSREKWDTMAAGPLFRPELDLVALNDGGAGVSALTAWWTGPGACGVIEPMGTHRDHWRQGHGTRVLRASFAALRRLGAAGVRVGVERQNAAAIATYRSVGFRVVGYDTTMVFAS